MSNVEKWIERRKKRKNFIILSKSKRWQIVFLLLWKYIFNGFMLFFIKTVHDSYIIQFNSIKKLFFFQCIIWFDWTCYIVKWSAFLRIHVSMFCLFTKYSHFALHAALVFSYFLAFFPAYCTTLLHVMCRSIYFFYESS